MKIAALFLLLVAQILASDLVIRQQQWPIHDNGLNSVVQWDHYSFIFKGQRLFVWSGEMHYWRAPVPGMWVDILQKVKAAGFNTISFYANWGYHNPKEGILDFSSGAHNFTTLFDIAKDLGLFVLFRPGPYVNAEANGGGFPGWVTTGAYGELRNNDSRYTEAWTPYFTKISEIISQYQITKGGPVFVYQVENEYGEQWKDSTTKTPNYNAIDYMEKLQACARSAGIDVPLIANNPNMNTKAWSKDFSDEGGNVDVYSLDHYPSCWSCNLAECTGVNGVVPEFTTYNYYNNFQEVAPTQPSFMAEFQGGSYNPWNGPQGGCGNTTGPDWVNVFYRHNIAQKVNAMNVYMLFGGTSWGGIPMPVVGTSYDYSAPISESRVIGDKYYETKLFSQFLRVARDLTKVELISNSTSFASTNLIYTTELRNPDTNAGFYITIHTSSPSTDLTAFKLNVNTSTGPLTIPSTTNTVLNGRESKIIVTDFRVGSYNLIYSTSEVFTVSELPDRTLVFLWLPVGEGGEFLLAGAQSGSTLKADGCANVEFTVSAAGVTTSYTQSTGSCVFEFDSGLQVVVIDRETAYSTWVPTTSKDPFTPENSTVVVQGPYLVRSVAIQDSEIKFTGDILDMTTLEVFAPASISSVVWNGAPLTVTKTAYGSLIGQLESASYTKAEVAAALPPLSDWKVADGLPERNADYDDSKWIVADRTESPNVDQPETFPVLYADEYGYHAQNILWRGRFSSSATTGVFLKVIGGSSSGWSAYLNGIHIGSWLGSSSLSTSNLTLSFDNSTLSSETDNVLFVIQDHMGHDQTSGATNPRGIVNATLLGPDAPAFTSWKVTGTAGVEINIDPVRGSLNEGGLHAERLGWHLPGFDDSTWEVGSPSKGLAEAGASFYRTVVDLDVQRGVDVSLGFVLGLPKGNTLRAQLYVNGYMFGKFVPWLGNQIVFPVFPGILNYHGPNTIGLNIWTLDSAGGAVSVDWTVLGVVDSSFDPGFASDELRPGWEDNRAPYY